jgi:uncharacterized protein with GYD domain
MPKYLIQASYTAEGVQGLVKDGAAGRKAVVQAATKAAGGKLEAFYYAFGEHDAVIIVDLPDNATAAAISLATVGSGAVRTKTTPLLTMEEVDKAIEVKVKYRAPGQ